MSIESPENPDVSGGGEDTEETEEKTPFSEAKEAIEKGEPKHLDRPAVRVLRADAGKKRGPLKNFKRKAEIEAELREANETIRRLREEVEHLEGELELVRERAGGEFSSEVSRSKERKKRNQDLFPGGFVSYIQGKAERMGLPPPPEMDRLLGDKSPDYKRWAEKYFPEESRLRYKHLYRVYKEGESPKLEKDKIQTVGYGVQEAYRIR